MRCALLFVGFLTTGTQAYHPAPIRLDETLGKKLFLVPTVALDGIATPKQLTLKKKLDSKVPYFTMNQDNTISFDEHHMRWCLEAGGTEHGNVVRVNHCTRRPTQKWRWLPWGPIQLEGTNQCIHVNENDGLSTASVELSDCANETNDMWIFEDAASAPARSSLQSLPFSVCSIGASLMVAALGLGFWMMRWQQQAVMVVPSKGGVLLNLDQGGVCLTASIAVRSNEIAMKGRPADRELELKRRKAEGAFTARANAAAATAPGKKQFMGSLTRIVDQAVKEVLGSAVQVQKAGSQKKGTQVASSDLDLFINNDPAKPMTVADKSRLSAALRKQKIDGNKLVIENKDWSIKIRCPKHNLTADLVPKAATFRRMISPPPTDRFRDNPRGREAVRNLKIRPDCKEYKGAAIERAVLKVQRENKGIRNPDLYDRAAQELGICQQQKQQHQRRARRVSCFLYDANHVKKEFDETATCVATNGIATIILYMDGECAWTSGLPDRLYNKLNGRSGDPKLAKPTYVALGSEDRYYVEFADGHFQWSGPEDMSVLLRRGGQADQKGGIASVAFGDDFDTFFLVYKNGGYRWNGNVPSDLKDLLEDRYRKEDLCCVSLGSEGQWFLKAKNQNMWWGGLADVTLQKIAKVEGTLKFLDFGTYEESEDLFIALY